MVDYRTAKALILSPHCDDVPLSLGALLLSGSLGPEPLTVVVFSQSRTMRGYPGNGSETKITALRNAEELRASGYAGYSVRFLGFPEPFVRPGYPNFTDIVNELRSPENDPIWGETSTAIQDLVSTHEGLILAPLGCGGHIDHRIVRNSVLELLAPRGEIRSRLGFYEDLPYAAFLSESEILAQVRRLGDIFVSPRIVKYPLDRKLELLGIYDSQLEAEEFEAVRKHWHRLGGERVWLPYGTALAGC